MTDRSQSNTGFLMIAGLILLAVGIATVAAFTDWLTLLWVLPITIFILLIWRRAMEHYRAGH